MSDESIAAARFVLEIILLIAAIGIVLLVRSQTAWRTKMNKWVSVGISAIVTFFITAGTAYQALGATAEPTKPQIATCIVGGLIAAARGVQQQLMPPPP